MRNILIISLLLLGFWACGDDEKGNIIANLPNNAFSFEPMPGGAIMRYILPDDPDIVGVNVYYDDVYGKISGKDE